ncbi:DNA repair protein complementing XP-C cells homolog [Spodoptera litura]|uniref:DNA repair protein complementing XP-C cells homolog n=1 Tax=Spodoptera litura TaxID=69820 RepID=A0A9J7IXQ2_SPOLT|nr:DNA repair protein complementing XP-C cells homolog [Spodoptera litura]
MPNTRKKVIKTVYKDEDSEVEDGDFSDSGSDAKFSPEDESSSEEEALGVPSSGEEFDNDSSAKQRKERKPKVKKLTRKPKFAQTIIQKINKQTLAEDEHEDDILPTSQFSVKDLTEADKILPKFNFSELNLSESDSSDDESQKISKKQPITSVPFKESEQVSTSDNEIAMEYKDVWSNNIQDNSEEIAKKAFLELEQHKTKIEETKASLLSYAQKLSESQKETDVKDLLALGEEAISKEPTTSNVKKKPISKKKKEDSDSELEDWEEVKESRGISPQGLQLFVEFPDAVCRKSKKVDVEMMMKRKINRVKKEYQVYMHKVHVLCWLGHGNFVSRVLNDQELMAAVLTLVPSKECYPGERVDMKYVEQITSWYKDKLKLKQDKHEDKFKPKAPPLKALLLDQIKNKTVTSKKYLVFIFVTMLRALGLQCRVMFNFVTLPKKPPSSELCSLSTKPKEEKKSTSKDKAGTSETKASTSKAKAGTSETKAVICKAKAGTSETKAGTSKAKPPNIKKDEKQDQKPSSSHSKPKKKKVAQVDGCDDRFTDSEDENIMQVDGNDDSDRKTRSGKRTKASETTTEKSENEEISPPKIPKKGSSSTSPLQPTLKQDESKLTHGKKEEQEGNKSQKATKGVKEPRQSLPRGEKVTKAGGSQISPTKSVIPRSLTRSQKLKAETSQNISQAEEILPTKSVTRGQTSKTKISKTLSPSSKDKDKELNTAPNPRTRTQRGKLNTENSTDVPKISVTDENAKEVASKYFEDTKPKTSRLSRKRSQTANPKILLTTSEEENKGNVSKPNARTQSAPGASIEKSKYFESPTKKSPLKRTARQIKKEIKAEDSQRVSHRDLAKSNKGKGDVTEDLVNIIKSRVKDAKLQSKKGLVKGKIKKESDEDSDYLPVEDPKRLESDSDDDFKKTKISPKASTSRQIDRRVLSSTSGDEQNKKKGVDVWCEIFVEELEQWICVDVTKGKVHSAGDIYNNATHPICYIVGWDNNNYVKDLTRKYVPHWNTITRKLRAESSWWETALKPWRGPRTARDREEDEYLDKMQLEAPLPKSIAEYKNHPLYALKRHLLKFEAIYPPDAAVLGYVRGEAVFARECVYVCRSRDIWLKEAKVVRLGEKPYKIVKARPKWDRLSNKMVDGRLLEIFGPWQVQDYEPPTAENGIVPRNAYGNVELFKDCMLPKGTVLIKLPNLMRVAKKLNIDCAPAMTGFDYNGGYSHPVYDGFVVCKEFEEIITEAWLKDQEEQERKEIQKIETRVYGNWKRLIRGLMIRERLKMKYGFEEPSTSETTKKSKGPRLVVKKKS